MLYTVTVEFESEPNDKGKTTKTTEKYVVEDELASGAEFRTLSELGSSMTTMRVTGVVEMPKVKACFLYEKTHKEALGLIQY
jgi:hypothetical protein